MKHLNKLAIAGLTVLAIMLLTIVGSMARALQTTTPYPTYPPGYPPSWQTQDAIDRQAKQAAIQTQQILALTPSPTGTIVYFNLISRPESIIPPTFPTYPSTPAGAGTITDWGDIAGGKLTGVSTVNKWSTQIDNKIITVYAGWYFLDQSAMQGAVLVTIAYADAYAFWLNDGGIYLTPDQTGAVHIVGAQGTQLILLSTTGKAYYFDVLGQRFITSLGQLVPTATPWPTWTPYPTFTSTANGDAPHTANWAQAAHYSTINTPLNYILSYANDEHWFRFRVPTPSMIEVHLTHLPANYDLFVFRAGYNYDSVGQSTNNGTADQQVIINNAPVDDYYVRVIGVNGAFDPIHPYQLEFDVFPNTPTPTPTPDNISGF